MVFAEIIMPGSAANAIFSLFLHHKSAAMSKCSLTLVPAGGLANRMRAVVSASNLCDSVGAQLQVVWFRDWALNAHFHEIFQPVSESRFALREAGLMDHLLTDRPRRHNLWIPRGPQQLLYDDRIYEQTVTPRKLRGFDFESWLRGRKCYMSCYQDFGTFDHKLYGQVFKPVREAQAIIDGYRSRFSPYTIGMHIRRTDNAESIMKSPTGLFAAAIRREQQAHPDLRVFLATDSEEVKRVLSKEFGERMIIPLSAADRSSADGIRAAVAEMWTLAATRKIYGSAGSSYSTMAASVGQVPLEILSV